MFCIFETAEFRRRLTRLPPNAARMIQGKIEEYIYPQLRQEPFFGPNIRKLKGYSPETWRYRLGRFRLFFAVDEAKRVVFILTIEPRKDAYR